MLNILKASLLTTRCFSKVGSLLGEGNPSQYHAEKSRLFDIKKTSRAPQRTIGSKCPESARLYLKLVSELVRHKKCTSHRCKQGKLRSKDFQGLKTVFPLPLPGGQPHPPTPAAVRGGAQKAIARKAAKRQQKRQNEQSILLELPGSSQRHKHVQTKVLKVALPHNSTTKLGQEFRSKHLGA